MAPVTQTDSLPAVSLTLVKPAHMSRTSREINPVPTENKTGGASGDGLSRDQLMQMIYNLLMLVGENMSIIQNTYAQNQMDQAKIAQDEANQTQQQTEQFLNKLAELQKKQEEAKKWGVFGNVMKWIGVAVGILVGALLCETPLGFLMLAAVIGFTASPFFNKAVDALGGAIGQAIGSSTWGNIIAQAIFLVALTVLTCGAEGLSTGLSKLATTAGEDAAEAGTQAAVQAAKETIQEVEEEVGEEISEDASSQASKASEQASDKTEQSSSKVSAKDFKPRWTYASATVFSQTLFATNLVQELLGQMVDAIPGGKNSEWAQILVQIFAIVAELAIAFASFKGVSGTEATNLMGQLSKLSSNPALIRMGVGAFVGTTSLVTAAANGGAAENTYEQGKIEGQIAPLQSNVLFGQGFFQVLTQLTSMAQQIYSSLMKGNTILFNTNFSSDWQACVTAQQYQG